MKHEYTETVENDHGRLETRRYWVTSKMDWPREREEWAGLTSVGMVESTRELDGKTSREVRYFISSLPGDAAKKFASVVRSHWSVGKPTGRWYRWPHKGDEDVTHILAAQLTPNGSAG